MSPFIQLNHHSVLPPLRAANKNSGMVRHERDRYDSMQCHHLRTGAYQIRHIAYGTLSRRHTLIRWQLTLLPASEQYQIVYLFFGLITFVVGVASYFWLSDSPATARYLTPEDRLKAVERLRANQQGSASTAFKFKQVIEMVLEPKFWLFMLLTFCGCRAPT